MTLRYWMPLAVLAITAQAHAQTTPTIVTVTGQRASVVNKVDRKVYRTDADLQATTGSAADILRNIPSVEVDTDGTISLRGDPGVTVLIDGKPSSQMQGASRGDALQNFSAADIQQIEVITSPSAEFKPDGSGGIINIVTKKKTRKTGSSGTVQANIGNDGRSNVNMSDSTAIGPFTLGGGLGLRQDARERSSHIQTAETDPATSAVTNTNQTIHQRENRRVVTAKASLDYAPNDKQTLSLAADYLTRHEAQSDQEHAANSGASQAVYDRNGSTLGPRTEEHVSAGFEQKLGHEGEVLSFNAQTGQSVESNIYDYVTAYSAPSITVTRTQQYGQQAYGVSEFSTGYVRPFASGSTLKLGYDVEYDQTGFNNSLATATPASGALIVNHADDNLFRYHQTINAAYATYDKTWGKLELLGGLRFEQVDIQTQQKVSGDASTQSYGKLYPTLNVLYALSDSDSLTAGYSKRVKRRDPEDLNPYINASDPHNLRQGNPALRPEMTDSLEIGYRHDANSQSYGLTGYYRKSRDGDTELLTVISSDVVLVTEANLPSSQSGGVEFIASGKLTPKLSYNLSGNLFETQLNAQALGVAGLRSAVALNSKASLDWLASTKDRWQISANYNGKRLTTQGYVLPVTTVNAGYRHQVDDKIAVVVTVSDLFNSQRQKRIYQIPNFSGIYQRQQTGQLIYAGLVYTFGAPKKTKDAGFTYDQ